MTITRFIRKHDLAFIPNDSLFSIPLSSSTTPSVVKTDENGNFLKVTPSLTHLKVYDDSEFQLFGSELQTREPSLGVLAVQAYCPRLFPDIGMVWTGVENDADFHPVFNMLKHAGHDVKTTSSEDPLLDAALTILGETNLDVDDVGADAALSNRARNKRLRVGRESPELLEALKPLGLTSEHVGFEELEHQGSKTKVLKLVAPILLVELVGFYQEADLFKVFGRNHHASVRGMKLASTRVIKETADGAIRTRLGAIMGYIMLNGQLTEFRMRLRDLMHRVPPQSGKGLDNQLKVFGCGLTKLDIATPEMAAKLGLKNLDEVKANMSKVFEVEPELAIRYAAMDVFAAAELDEKQLELVNRMRTLLGLEPSLDVKDTAGSNVSKVLNDAMMMYFGANDADSRKAFNEAVRNANIDSLMHLPENKFGHQALNTVGGLLFSRVSKHPHIVGDLGDLDESSCYATSLSSMNLYLGRPMMRTFKRSKDRPKLLETVQTMLKEAPRDGWMLRVSGSFTNGFNTLIQSDLEFTRTKQVFSNFRDKVARTGNKQVLSGINLEKVGKPEASSRILTNEVKFGVVTAETWDCIKLLPPKFQEDYHNLEVDAVIYHPSALIVDTLEQKEKLIVELNLPDDENSVQTQTVGITTSDTYLTTKAHVTLRFPAGQFYSQVKAVRAEAKANGEPVQELFKLLLNATFGALACSHLRVNNKLASNVITASARATSWLMMNFLNGFQVITDGCQFNWKNIPIGHTFHEVLERYPDYLLHYQPDLTAATKKDELSEKTFKQVLKQQQDENLVKGTSSDKLNPRQVWIERCFQKEMERFYGATAETCRPLGRFEFELKTESLGDEKLTEFQEFFNTGAGNYQKLLTKGGKSLKQGSAVAFDYEVNGTDYRTYDRVPTASVMKARAYRAKDDVIAKWFRDSLTGQTKSSMVLHETDLLSLSEATQEAIDELNRHPGQRVVIPLGFEKTTPKMMKLVTHSQFLFQTEDQFNGFLKFEEEFFKKTTSLLQNTRHWETLTDEEMTSMNLPGLKLNSVEMVNWVKNHKVAFGFEVLSWTNRNFSDLAAVRTQIAELVEAGTTAWERKLKTSDALTKLSREHQLTLTELTIRRWLAKQELRQTMRNSTQQSTLLQASLQDVSTISDEVDGGFEVNELDELDD